MRFITPNQFKALQDLTNIILDPIVLARLNAITNQVNGQNVHPKPTATKAQAPAPLQTLQGVITANEALLTALQKHFAALAEPTVIEVNIPPCDCDPLATLDRIMKNAAFFFDDGQELTTMVESVVGKPTAAGVEPKQACEKPAKPDESAQAPLGFPAGRVMTKPRVSAQPAARPNPVALTASATFSGCKDRFDVMTTMLMIGGVVKGFTDKKDTPFAQRYPEVTEQEVLLNLNTIHAIMLPDAPSNEPAIWLKNLLKTKNLNKIGADAAAAVAWLSGTLTIPVDII